MTEAGRGAGDHYLAVHRYFEALGSTWDAHYAAGGSMMGRPARFMSQLVSEVRLSSKILDFGCGTGDVAAHLAARGYRVCGVDQCPAMISRARRRFEHENLTFEVLPPALEFPPRLPFGDRHFGACVASSVLEYVCPLDIYLSELRRVVDVKGKLFATVPNPVHPLRLLERCEQSMLASLPIARRMWTKSRCGYLASSVNRLSVAEWRSRLRDHGWLVRAIVGRGDALLFLHCEAC